MSLPRFFVFAVVLLSYCSVPTHGMDKAELQAALNCVLDQDPTARRTMVALKVVDLKSGEVLYDRHGERLFTPASNLKIYTSACALDAFGPDHCFPTIVTVKVDREAGTLHGDLKIVGGGNAMLSHAELKKLAERVVKTWGVRRLLGKVVVDNSRYSDTQLGPGWMWDDQPYYFNMRVTPLMVDFNTTAIAGSVGRDGKERREAMREPGAWCAKEFGEMLRDLGVKFGPAEASPPRGDLVVIRFQGMELSETLRHFNHKSENAVGEVLLHELAIAGGKVRPTWSDGAEVITAWLHDTAGLERGSFKLVDGSGLSRYNLISADSSVKLLAFMRQHKHSPTFFDALPAYEVETPNGKKQKLVHAKSGGMSGVSTISGYVQTLDGRELAFSLLGNGFIGTSKPVISLRGKVWKVLVQYTELVSAQK